ncbi:MAG: cysteine--tRNA ligase, partial [Eudoraea sp.]
PILIAQLFEGVKHINLINDGKEKITEGDLLVLKTTIEDFVFDVLGIEPKNSSTEDSNKLDGVVKLLIELRNDARANKDFSTSDKIRDQLSVMGIQLKDGKEGTTFSI